MAKSKDRGYVSILMPNTGNTSPVENRTKITQSGGLSNSPGPRGKNFDNKDKTPYPKKSGSYNYEGLDPNCNLAHK